jgi:hypothetical protein
MKKNALVFGLLSGLIITAFMVYSTASCYLNANYRDTEVIGYAGMLVAASFIFVGVKNYRDKHNGGIISFGKAFKTGLFITFIAATLYVLVWLVEYYFFFPDWLDKFCTHMIKEAKAAGVSQQELNTTYERMNFYREAYKNPLFVVLLTYAEPLMVGLPASLICALILKRKRPKQGSLAPAMAS